MLVALHRTLERFLKGVAPTGSLLAGTAIDFSVPDASFRGSLSSLTLNLYLHEVRENLEMRRVERWLEHDASRRTAGRRRPPALIDCSYCVTAWSALARDNEPVMEEHRLLGEVIRLVLMHQRIAPEYWQEGLGDQLPPYPTLVAQPDAIKNQAEFWTALGHPPKPMLVYVVTIAVPVHDTTMVGVVGPSEEEVRLHVDHRRLGDA